LDSIGKLLSPNAKQINKEVLQKQNNDEGQNIRKNYMMTLMKFADKNFATDINTIKLSQMINKQTFFSSVTFFCVFVRFFENRINRVRGTMTLT
jgi:hypothetical protein